MLFAGSPGLGSTIARAAARFATSVVALVMLGMRAVGRDEVDQRLGVLQVLPEVAPTGVRSQLAVVGLGEQLPAHVVQRRNARLTSTRHVDCRQVERQTQQVVAQGLGDELVDLVARLIRGAHEHAARALSRRERPGRPAVEELRRIQERREQRYRVVGLGARHRVDVRTRDRVVEHRVAEAVDRVRELRVDGRVDVRRVDVERPDRRLDLASELLEDEVLVLHLGHEASRLEQPLTVAVAAGAVRALDASGLPLRESRDAGR